MFLKDYPFLRESSVLLPTHIRSILYKTMVAPPLIIVMSFCRRNKFDSNKLQIFTSRAAKIIIRTDRYDLSSRALCESKCFKVWIKIILH